MKVPRAAARALGACALVGIAAFAHAQSYPAKPVTLLGPAGVPANAVKVISESTAKALQSKDVIDALMNQGIEPAFAGPADLGAFLKADLAMWAKLVKESGVKPQ